MAAARLASPLTACPSVATEGRPSEGAGDASAGAVKLLKSTPPTAPPEKLPNPLLVAPAPFAGKPVTLASPTWADGVAAVGATMLPFTPCVGSTVAPFEAAARAMHPAVSVSLP